MTSRDKAQAGLQSIREAIAEALAACPGATAAQIQRELGLDPWQVMQVVAKLMAESGHAAGGCC